MRKEIRSATSSMTSVPKPLKFLRPHYGALKSYFETLPESELKKYMADILSVSGEARIHPQGGLSLFIFHLPHLILHYSFQKLQGGLRGGGFTGFPAVGGARAPPAPVVAPPLLSVLALTMSVEGERESLKYRLLGSEGDIGSWGHEYVRNLAGEIAQEFQKRQDDDLPIDALMELVLQIISFHMKHNAEPEAVDLLMEV